MSSAHVFGRFWDDIHRKFCLNRFKFIVTVAAALAGFIIGIVLIKACGYGWWYSNRIDYADKLFGGGFTLLLRFAFSLALYGALVLVCGMRPQLRYCSLAVLVVACLYCGANTAAAIICWKLWGLLFALLVSTVEVAGLCMTVFLAICRRPACRTLSECFCDSHDSLLALCATFACKFVAFFVLLRLLTALI